MGLSDVGEDESQEWNGASYTGVNEELWANGYEARRGNSSFTSVAVDDKVLGLRRLDEGEMGKVDS
jgi:hypothetical protein